MDDHLLACQQFSTESHIVIRLADERVSFLNINDIITYILTYHSRFIPEGVAEVSQIFLRDTHVLPKLFSYEEHCRRDRW
jgi:hypothetical protein